MAYLKWLAFDTSISSRVAPDDAEKVLAGDLLLEPIQIR